MVSGFFVCFFKRFLDDIRWESSGIVLWVLCKHFTYFPLYLITKSGFIWSLSTNDQLTRQSMYAVILCIRQSQLKSPHPLLQMWLNLSQEQRFFKWNSPLLCVTPLISHALIHTTSPAFYRIQISILLDRIYRNHQLCEKLMGYMKEENRLTILGLYACSKSSKLTTLFCI